MEHRPVIDRVRRAVRPDAWRPTDDIHAATRREGRLPTTRAVQYALARLEAAGEVEREPARRQNRPDRWRLKAAA